MNQISHAPKTQLRTLQISPPRIAPDISNLNHSLFSPKASWNAKGQLVSRRFQRRSFLHDEMYENCPTFNPCCPPPPPRIDTGRSNLKTIPVSTKPTRMPSLRIFGRGRQKCFRKVTIRHIDACGFTPEALLCPHVKRLLGNTLPLWSCKRARTNNLHLVRP